MSSSYVYRQYRDQDSSPLMDKKGGDQNPSTNVSTTYPSDAVIIEPLQVKVISHQLDRASKIFRSMVQKEGVIATYKKHQAYEKPSEARRRKANEGKRLAFETRMAEIRPPRERKMRRRPVQEETSELV